MQKLRDLAQQVEAIYGDMASTFIDYQNRRQLFCRSGCGKCCLHPNIHASVLEMLPLALSFYDKGEAETVLGQLQEYRGEHCFFYQSTSADNLQGYCGIYEKRGSVCRMFGAAGYPDKYGKPELSTCQIIKTDNADAYEKTVNSLESDPPPMMKHWKSFVANVDYELGHEELPLLEAVEQALVKVLTVAAYGDGQ